jgi:prolyl-tRNA synthetase
MRMSKLVGERFKQTPSDCVIDSHILLIRGGYMKYVASGIYTLLPALRRVTRKIEAIIREEMDAIDAQEVLLPVTLPGSLWEQSGRFDSVGKELLRFQDRNGQRMVLGMTHEEAAVQAVKEYGASPQRYPFMIYQIQTKFRDEARPRGGLIRVREFTMKDAYSFHTSQQDLDECYERCHEAYLRIFRRAGLPVVSVAADSGMMGGSVSHEFMYLTDVGEDSIALCDACGYRANVEVAENVVQNTARAAALRKVATPGVRTIGELCAFLGTSPEHTVKAVVYRAQRDGRLVILFTRGDMEASEAKITSALGDEIRPATLGDGDGLAAGFIGPAGLDAGDAALLYDRSLLGAEDLICGANEPGSHFTGFSPSRDLGNVPFGDYSKILSGGVCPECGRAGIRISRGIEVGNIFQLGDKYTRPMGMTYDGADGSAKYPLMGCYGIGVGRLAAAVCEEHHDANGPVWPMAVAPWQVEVCCVRADREDARAAADALYGALTAAGIEVLYDDRVVSAGVMFSEADLMGAPLRAIVSPRNLEQGIVEIASRDGAVRELAPLNGAAEVILGIVACLSAL